MSPKNRSVNFQNNLHRKHSYGYLETTMMNLQNRMSKIMHAIDKSPSGTDIHFDLYVHYMQISNNSDKIMN